MKKKVGTEEREEGEEREGNEIWYQMKGKGKRKSIIAWGDENKGEKKLDANSFDWSADFYWTKKERLRKSI